MFFHQMTRLKFKIMPVILAAAVFSGGDVHGQNLDQIGVTLLRAMTTNLDGTGIRVAQPEANNGDNGSTNAWEVNPTNVAQPVTRFIYISALGTSMVYTNAVGTWSSHADAVGNNFYGLPNGVATNVAHVDNYDADFFINNYVFNLLPALPASVVNQSFSFGSLSVSDQQAVDSAYDDYAETYSVLFVSAVDNGGNVHAPGTGYNGIGVAVYNGGSSIGPTVDNGRCKPDLTVSGYPAGFTSFSTPYVSGAAAVLKQAALRGDGGGDTNSAFDMRTIKALLLNGAVKPIGWTNSNSSPLDARYGAGVVNIFNSYEQLAGGKHSCNFSTNTPLGGAHPPFAGTNLISALSGWDFATNSTGATNDFVSHYFFNVTNAASIATATLVWNRQLGETNINDLDLFLFNAANSSLVACSTSRVDNVEHIFAPQLAAGRYDLQVLKNGGPNAVSSPEIYALAWAFVSPKLQVTKSGANAALTWPVYPAGFLVESATNLISPNWNTNNLPASIITNGQNYILLNATNATQFFRLRSPNF